MGGVFSPVGGGGGGLFQYGMPRCMRWRSKDKPIVKTVPILKGSAADYISP